MAAYADWVYYGTTYLGTAIAVDEFNSLALRASARIDQMTFNRVAEVISDDGDDDKIDLIKMAVCAVADELHRQSSEGPQVAGERVGSYSKTYVVTSEMKIPAEEKITRAAKLYLGSTGLIFTGFAADELGGVSAD